MDAFIAHLVVFLCIYWMLALSMDLLLGFAGIFNLAQGALFGLAAYSAGVSTTHFGVNPWIGLSIGILIASIAGVLIGALTTRLDADYLALATLGLAACFEGIVRNWTAITGGARGLGGIPKLELFTIPLRHPINFVSLAIISAVVCAWVVHRFARSQLGAITLALQESVPHTQALGFGPGEVRFLVAVLSGAMAGVAGGLYAFYLGTLDPTRFTANEAFLVASIVIVGGRASALGALIGAAFFVGLPEILRFTVRTSSESAAIREIVLACCVLGTLLVRPRGVLGRRWIE